MLAAVCEEFAGVGNLARGRADERGGLLPSGRPRVCARSPAVSRGNVWAITAGNGHIGSARHDAGLEVLSAARRPRLAAGQDEL